MLVLTRGQISEKKLPKSRFTSILTVFQNCAEMRQGDLAPQDVKPWNAGYEDPCWAVLTIAWHIRCCWSANQRNSQFCLWLLRYRREIQERCKLVALLQKSVMGNVHMHGIKLNGSMTIWQGRRTPQLLCGDLHLYLLLWKTWNMKEQLWKIRDFQSLPTSISAKGSSEHFCPSSDHYKQAVAQKNQNWHQRVSEAPLPHRPVAPVGRKPDICKQTEAQSPGMPWEQPWGSAELSPLQLCRGQKDADKVAQVGLHESPHWTSWAVARLWFSLLSSPSTVLVANCATEAWLS